MKSIIVIFAVVLVIGLVVFIIFKWYQYEHRSARLSSSRDGSNDGDIVELELARKIQREYWTPSAEEKAQFLKRNFDDLTWKDKLRLLHLTCLEAVPKNSEKELLISNDPGALEAPNNSNRDLIEKLLSEIISPDSPFRPRYAAVWQIKDSQPNERNPDLEGVLRNESLTHNGCLEVIHLDENSRPKSLDFIPFDDLRGVVFAKPALYSYAKLLFDDGRKDEIVLIPLLYGISFMTKDSVYQDGRITRFLYYVELAGIDQSFAIGIGHQDLSVIQKDHKVLFGIGSLIEIAIALDVNDPRFEKKCQSRGIDPAEVRQSMSK